MPRRVKPLFAAGAVVFALAATAIGVAAMTDSSDASGGTASAPVAAPAVPDVIPVARGAIGGTPVTLRVIVPRGSTPQAGATVTVVARTRADLTGMRVTGPGGTALPAMTGALFISHPTGEIDAPTATTHGHVHSQGQGLGTALGATGVFAAKMSGGSSTAAVDSQGTRLAATYPDAGAVEMVDLVRATRPRRLQGLGRPTAAWFAPSGQDVWVNDADAGVRVLDAEGRASGVIGGAPGRNVVAFSPDRGLALIAGDGTNEAVVMRTADHARTATLDLPAPATSAAFISSPPSIVVSHADGSMTVAPLNRAAGDPFRTQTGIPGGADTTAVVTPDGTRAALLLPSSRRMAVLDLTRHRLLATVGTGADPTGLVLLQRRFAVTRSRTQGTATWVDVRTPARAADLPLGDRPASSMTLTEGGSHLLFTDPGARQVLDVHPMMGRPMVMDVIPGTFAPDDVVAFPGGLRRSGPQEYRRSVVLRDDGAHRVTVTSTTGSFAAVIPGRRAPSVHTATVASLPGTIQRGTKTPIALTVSGRTPTSVEVLMVSSGRTGVHQVRAHASPRHGIWTARVRPRAAGKYTVFAVVDGSPVEWRGRAAPTLAVSP